MAVSNNLLIGAAFLSGVAVGVFAGTKLMEKKLVTEFEVRLEKETADVRAFYGGIQKQKYPTPADAVDDLVVPEVAKSMAQYQGRGGTPVAYDKIVQSTSPKTEEVEMEEEPRTVQRNVFDKEDRGEVYVISQEEYMENETDYIQSTLTYYRADNILADDREERIEDFETMIGPDAVANFGQNSSDPNVVHVRNERIQLEFEICLAEGSYGEVVLGMDAPLETPRSRLRGQ